MRLVDQTEARLRMSEHKHILDKLHKLRHIPVKHQICSSFLGGVANMHILEHVQRTREYVISAVTVIMLLQWLNIHAFLAWRSLEHDACFDQVWSKSTEIGESMRCSASLGATLDFHVLVSQTRSSSSKELDANSDIVGENAKALTPFA